MARRVLKKKWAVPLLCVAVAILLAVCIWGVAFAADSGMYTLTLTVSDASFGRAEGGGQYQAGADASLLATPAGGCYFTGWYEDGVLLSEAPSLTLERLSANRSLEARFAANETVPIVIQTGMGGEIWQAGKNYPMQSYHKEDKRLGVVQDLTAVANEGASFRYWVDMESNRVLSDDPHYVLTVSRPASLRAVFLTPIEGRGTVTYLDSNQKVLDTNSYAIGAQLNPPTPVRRQGYRFTGWKRLGDADGGLIDMQTQTVEASSVIYIAAYEKDTAVLYKISVSGGVSSAPEAGVPFNTRVTVRANEPPAGQVFSHWLKNGEIASFNQTYSFYAGEDADLQAVFAQQAATQAPVLLASRAMVDGAAKTVSFLIEWDVPDDVAFLGAGLIYTTYKSVGTSDGFVMGAENVKLKRSSNLQPNGQYIWTKTAVTAGTSVYTRGYITYMTRAGEVVTQYTGVQSGVMILQ